MRDYAKNYSPRRNPDRAWILVLLVICALGGLLFYLYHELHHYLQSRKIPVPAAIVKPVAKHSTQKITKKTAPKSSMHYDFYRLLPETKVETQN